MRILRVALHNYRVYAGKQDIDLTDSASGKPVVLIGGLNGEGKTTLLEGLQLCLYGRRAEFWRQNGTTYSEYLAQSIHRGADPSSGAMVQVEFETPDAKPACVYRVQRTWKRNGGGKISEYVQVFVDGSLDKHLSETWGDQVERFVPARLAGLFFFDGERIKHYADAQRSRELIERGLLSLLGIDLIDQLSTDLRALDTRLAQTRKKIEQDEITAKLEVERNSRIDNLEHLAESIASLRNDYDQQERLVVSLDREFEKCGGELFEKRTALERERQLLDDRHKQAEQRLIGLSAGALPLAIARDLLARTRIQMQVEIQAIGSATTLQRLEGQHRRLVKLLKREKVAKKTRDLLGRFYEQEFDDLNGIAELPTYLEINEVDFVSAMGLLETTLPELQEQAADELSALEVIEAELQAVDRKLGAVPDDAALAEVQSKREEAKHKKGVLQGRLEQLEEDYRLARLHLQEAEDTLHKHLVKVFGESHDEADKARVLDHAEQVRSTLKVFRKRLITRRVSQLEQVILESYVHLMRKTGMVARLSIDPGTFELTLYNTKDQEIQPDWLSAGERQLLVVSILWGFARASGRSLPVIVDTPLGRLDSTHRENLVRHYFPYASHQVILLSTDEEITGTTLRRLKPAIGHQFRLVYDEATDSTSIRNGYFKERAHAN